MVSNTWNEEKIDLFMLLIRENGSRNSNLFDDNMVKKYFQYIT